VSKSRKLLIPFLAAAILASAGCATAESPPVQESTVKSPLRAEAEAAAESCTSKDGIKKVIEQGYLDVGASTTAPQSFKLENGDWTGFDADILTEMATRMGVGIKPTFPDGRGQIAGLQSGRLQATTGLFSTPERAESASFTKPYRWTDTGLVVHSDETEIDSFEDLAGKKIGTPSGNIGEIVANNLVAAGIPVEKVVAQGWQDVFQLLATKRVDAIVYQSSYLNWLKSQTDTFDFKVAAPMDNQWWNNDGTPPSRFVVSKTSCGEALAKIMDVMIDDMAKDGTFEKIYAKYGITEKFWEEH
jgi:ABC-type amino acid transport substrate-binding protein